MWPMKEAITLIQALIEDHREPTMEFGGIYSAKVVQIRYAGVIVMPFASLTPVLLPGVAIAQFTIESE